MINAKFLGNFKKSQKKSIKKHRKPGSLQKKVQSLSNRKFNSRPARDPPLGWGASEIVNGSETFQFFSLFL